MNHLDLCSGIGGFALAARWMGWDTVAFCEIDKFCQSVLRKHWPDVEIHDDLKQFSGVSYRERIGILTAGYPCQPFSQAGRQKGTEDPRHLWPEVFRVIQECRPSWIMCENVSGHVRLGLDAVLADLESEGYSARATLIPACATGAPHRRDRVWIIAYSYAAGLQRGESAGDSGGNGQESDDEYARRCTGASSSYTSSVGLPDWAGGSLGQPGPLTEFERSDGESGKAKEWETFSLVRRVDNGLPDRVDRYRRPARDRAKRLKALGNAIVPQVVYEIFKAIEAIEASRQ